jgi:hypothetical protein
MDCLLSKDPPLDLPYLGYQPPLPKDLKQEIIEDSEEKTPLRGVFREGVYLNGPSKGSREFKGDRPR